MPPTVDEITLNNGYKIPVIGLGTWQARDAPSTAEYAVKVAIDEGYRYLDCASGYGNEEDVGRAIQSKIEEGVVTREDLFVSSKVWNDEHEPEAVVAACRRSLRKLGVDYLDMFLVHWPLSYKIDESVHKFRAKVVWKPENHVDIVDTWRGMEECVNLGLVRSIGISNFNCDQTSRIYEAAIIKPVMNQIELHIYLNQRKLREFCASKDIAVTAYSPLCAQRHIVSPYQPDVPDLRLDVDEISEIAKKYNKTCAQVALRYLIDIGTVIVPKSSSPVRLRENIDIFDFKLTEDEIAIIDTLDRGYRITNAEEFKDFKEFPFDEE